MTEEIVEKLNAIANVQGKTLYGLLNELGLLALEAHASKIDLSEALKAKKLFDRAKRTRLILVNQDSWYLASSKSYKSSKTEWLEHIYKNAKWYADLSINQNSREEKLRSLEKFIDELFWDCTDMKMDQEDGNLRLKLAFVPEMSIEHTSVLFKQVEGVCNAIGYVVLDHTINPGVIMATFTELRTVIQS